MTARSRVPLDSTRLSLADRVARLTVGRRQVDDRTRLAVNALTASADPGRADRLALRPGESAVLAERLAVWALHHATDDAVATAAVILRGRDRATAPRAVDPVLVA